MQTSRVVDAVVAGAAAKMLGDHFGGGEHSAPPTTFGMGEDAQFWGDFGWIAIPDGPERNLDGISADRLPRQGCPACGGVWTSVLAAGFKAPRVFRGTLYAPDHPARMLLAETAPTALVIEAFDLSCFSEHRFRYHERTGKLTPLPELQKWLPLVMAAFASYVGMYALMGKR